MITYMSDFVGDGKMILIPVASIRRTEDLPTEKDIMNELEGNIATGKNMMLAGAYSEAASPEERQHKIKQLYPEKLKQGQSNEVINKKKNAVKIDLPCFDNEYPRSSFQNIPLFKVMDSKLIPVRAEIDRLLKEGIIEEEREGVELIPLINRHKKVFYGGPVDPFSKEYQEMIGN